MALSTIGGRFKGVISKDQDLLDAAKNGNVEAIGKLTAKKRQSTASQFLPSFLKGSVNINCTDREGYTPLHLATLNGHKAAVECLLSLEASVSLKDNSGCTPLHLAAWKGYDEICKLFLSLSKTAIPIDSQNSLGDTALHMASQYGYSSVVRILLLDQYNADTTIRNLKDESALDLASQYGRYDVVQLLVNKNPDLVKHTVMSHSPLHLAVACGHIQIINALLDAGFDINTKTVAGTALHTAAMYCKTDVVKVLVVKGIDIHAADSEGKTALEIILKNDQTQHKYAEIAKFIRDHIMKSDIKDERPKMVDGNVYGTAFDVNTATPPLAPKVDDTDLTKNQIDNRKPAETKTRPTPKPTMSLGETDEERKSAMYSKPDKDRFKIRIDDSLASPPTVPPRVSHVFMQEQITEEKHPPDLPKKDRDSIPPLPPKTDDIPLLPPKVMFPTTDMVVADLPPVRIKSGEILDLPPPCEGGIVDPDLADDDSIYANVGNIGSPGGYFVMSDKSPIAKEVSTLSPASSKKRPVKPPRKKSPAPARKNETSPLQVQEIDANKVDYETMSNVVKKPDENESKAEDVYNVLFPSFKTEPSDTKNSSDATNPADNVPFDPVYTNTDTKNSSDATNPAENVPSDPVYTNINAAADLISKDKTDTSKTVPFTKYNDDQTKLDQNLIRTERVESHVTESREEIYQNLSSDERTSLSDRSSTGFQQVEVDPVAKEQSEIKPLTSVIETESAEQVTKTLDSKETTKQESESTLLMEKVCHSNGCDSSLDKNIPDNLSQIEKTIPEKCYKHNSEIPDESNIDIPNETLQTKNCIPNDILQSESSIPQKTLQSESNIPEPNLQSESNIPEPNLQNETCIPCSCLQSDSDIPIKSCQNETQNEDTTKRGSFTPELPPKSGQINEDLSEALASDEKRISNGSTETKDEIDEETESKVPKPPSLEFTKKRKSEHKFPMTPTGYPQPPTPDFPPPSPNTAMKGIEQKIAGIEVPSTKRQSRDIETITEDITINDKSGGDNSSTMNDKSGGDNSSTINDKSGGDNSSTISDKSGGDNSSKDVKTDSTDRDSDKITENGSSELKDTDSNVARRITTKEENESKPQDEKPCDVQEEVVVMRRSARLSSSGSSQEVLVIDELEPFAGLLRGSVVGGPRKVVSQIYEHVALPHKKTGAKRTSLPLGNMTFEPVMEREEDVGHEKVIKSERTQSYETRPVMKDDGSFNEPDEWDQIADIVSSFGGKLSHDEMMSVYDVDISHLLEADIMASFGAGIDRESVFVEKFEALFTKHLAVAGSNLPIHSVGEWLESLGLGQYENTLYANGFDDTDFLGDKIMEDQDLDSIGIITVEHRKKILDHAKDLPQITTINAETPPESVESWLNSLRLPQYLDKFISHKYDTMERVLQVWELELSTVLDISSLGHRKRILASLGDRSPPERQFSSLKKKSLRAEENKDKSPFKDINLYRDYTKVKPLNSTSEEEVSKSSKSEAPSVDNSDNDEVFQNNVQGKSIKDTTIHIRPPHQANITSGIKQWGHRPEMLIKGCCNYTAQYLGSTLVKELTGTSSTIEGIAKLKKSSDAIAKIPTIMLSISYRGVKFIDAKSKKVICDHEIVNIFCACQDAENMNFFAYITRDNETGKHYCHVFSVRTAELGREVIMTLGEAFEVAYQMAQKERAAEEAKEFERTLSQSDAEDSSQSKSSSKASLNTV